MSANTGALAQFTSPEFLRDPYPFFRRLRENDPVHRTTMGFYLVTRHADASFILAEEGRLFRAPEAAQVLALMPQAAQHRAQWMFLNSLLAQNPPGHTRLRRLVARTFTPKAVTEFRERLIIPIVGRLLDSVHEPLCDGEVVDLHSALAQLLPLLVMAELLGVPEADHGWLIKAAVDIAGGVKASKTEGSEHLLELADAQTERMEDYFTELVVQRRRSPGGDLISGLIGGHDEDRLTAEELVNLVWLMWIAGTDTTAISMDHCLWTMAAHPEHSHRLAEGGSATAAYVEEVLRRTSPVMFSAVPKVAIQEVELGGYTLPAGSDVRPVFAAINRDPAVFPDPDRFDPARDTSSSLTMGKGIHQCLGAFLARAELATAVHSLHTRFPGLVVLNEPEWAGMSCDLTKRTVPVVLEKLR